MDTKKSPSPIDRHIGARIRARRTLIGMSQEKLGEALGLTFQQVQKYEKGTNRVGSGRLQEIGDILGVQVTYFFEGQDGERKTKEGSPIVQEIEEFLSQKDSIELLSAFNAISNADMRRALINMARASAGLEKGDGIAAPLNGRGHSPRRAYARNS
ncbi:helix-turn-helix domain-containing protein [Microvirga sp. BT291]|uniref:helix-turn-helix domain-containing protein n=1 Tax=Microvirga pudoricolor TaxID=2778729 RepID=UPI00195168DE|nr:helix-turn-helix domain-containing protein [Microvirga pudoricolor]